MPPSWFWHQTSRIKESHFSKKFSDSNILKVFSNTYFLLYKTFSLSYLSSVILISVSFFNWYDSVVMQKPQICGLYCNWLQIQTDPVYNN
jgi:hypothetical protein